MREIKFRAWNSSISVLANVIEIRFNQNSILTDDSKFLWDLNKVVLEQYTGIDDRVGNAVHENDIVEIDYRRGDHTVLDPQTLGMVEQWGDIDTILRGVVHIWPSTGVIINNISSENPEQFVGDYKVPQYLHINRDCIVIGNIHENADLLEEQ
ncbi:YopX family protein [Leuconostoc mesenteroides]|nr:YopX family protein [Leuconostoc mesenteroides]